MTTLLQDRENIIRAINALHIVEDFLIAGKCPKGVRPIIIEKLADILAFDTRPQILHARLTHRVDYKGLTLMFATSRKEAERYAKRNCGKVITNLRSVETCQ